MPHLPEIQTRTHCLYRLGRIAGTRDLMRPPGAEPHSAIQGVCLDLIRAGVAA